MRETSVERRWAWRWGVNRWLVLAFIVLGAFAASTFPPVRPEILLPAEALSGPLFSIPGIGELRITNTLVALVFADILLLLLALSVRRAVTSKRMHPLTGITGAVEALLEYLYNLTESTAGRWAGRIFPWVGTIVLLVLVANWMELIPGVDSVGLLHHAEAEGHPTQELFRVGNLPVVTIVGGETAAEGHEGFTLVPYVRAVATDLNFPLALALVSVVMTQVYGVWSQGVSYFTKFFNARTLFNRPFFGTIDFGVGLLELVSEISKVISFTFRLFGNIFAGSVLLFVIGSLVPVFAQTLFLMLEFFVGMIQAIIFGMLTLVFMAQAVAGHGHGPDEAPQGASHA